LHAGSPQGTSPVSRNRGEFVPQTAPTYDRFAHWERWPARIVLAVLAAFMVLAVLSPITVGRGEVARPPALGGLATAGQTPVRFDDLRLYDAVIARLARGERYYDVVAQEHRKLPFPLKPGFAVRLPTLAVLAAWLGPQGLAAASVVLALALGLAWWRRLGEEPGGRERRLLAMILLLAGANFVLVRYFHVLHELWAGGLLALAFALHRPGQRWLAALLLAALALAIRETALPFVLLAAAMAAWRRDWRECCAWTALAGLFVAGWAWHLHQIALLAQPGDPQSAPWLTLRGLSGLLSLYVLPTPLRFLPAALAGPVVVLCLFGWSGWKSPAGSFGTLLLLGYGLGFMIAGRPENWYWGALVTPVLFIGLAFLPMALRSVWLRARQR
jgi:hypothetical protein